MEQSDAKKPLPETAKSPKKMSVVGKFLKDVGIFLFGKDQAGNDIRRDLLTLEMTRAKERSAAKAAEVAKAAQARAKEQTVAKAAQDRFARDKQITAEQFRAESDRMRQENQRAKERQVAERAAREAVETVKAAVQVNAAAVPPAPGPVVSRSPMAQPSIPPILQATKTAPSLPKEKAAQHFQSERLKHETANQRERIENRAWQSYHMVSTNLIKDRRSMFLDWPSRLLWLVLFAALSVLLCFLSFGLLQLWEKDRLKANDYVFQNYDNAVAQINRENAKLQEIMQFNDKLLAADYLLRNHLYWTKFFKFLENNTIKDVYFESFSGDTAGKYTVPAVAKDFRAISLQLKVLQADSKEVTSVDSGAATTDNGVSTTTPQNKVKFNLNLNLNRSVFIKDPQYDK